MAEKSAVTMPSSKIKSSIAKVMLDEGYIKAFDVKEEEKGKSNLTVTLKYFNGASVIEELKRVSRPGLRKYSGTGDIPKVWDGLGTVIITTSKGAMTDKQARKLKQGGEILCYIA